MRIKSIFAQQQRFGFVETLRHDGVRTDGLMFLSHARCHCATLPRQKRVRMWFFIFDWVPEKRFALHQSFRAQCNMYSTYICLGRRSGVLAIAVAARTEDHRFECPSAKGFKENKTKRCCCSFTLNTLCYYLNLRRQPGANPTILGYSYNASVVAG
jgi:hypothetical protein